MLALKSNSGVSPDSSTSTSIPETRRRRILIVDDHPIIAFGFAQLIESQTDLVICGVAATPELAMALISTTAPDMALIDITLKDGNGVALLRAIRKANTRMGILIISIHDEMIYAERLLLSGANGFLQKGTSLDEVLRAVRKIMDGGIYVSSAVSARMAEHFRLGNYGVTAYPTGELTMTEVSILRLIAVGLAPRECARELKVSPKAVNAHLQEIKRKLHLSGDIHLTQFAIHHCSSGADLSTAACTGLAALLNHPPPFRQDQ